MPTTPTIQNTKGQLSIFNHILVQFISDLHKFVNKILWNLKIYCTVSEIGAKYILYARNAPTMPIFEYSVLRSNCLHPY